MSRIDWGHVLTRAAEVVRSYDTPVTLRQLYYRLVSEQLIPNRDTSYKRLSSVTAEARRIGDFPALVDKGRAIHRPYFDHDVASALRVTIDSFRLDRTIGQEVSLYLAVEKNGLVSQMRHWFDRYGLPVLAMGGYASQSYVDEVAREVERQHRPAVLLYAGDFDPTGMDIPRDFTERTDCWAGVHRVALDAEQVDAYRLPPNPGKVTDPRAAAFTAEHGQLVQVELDALDPPVLRHLFTEAMTPYWDMSAYEEVMRRETAELDQLRAIAGGGRHE